MLQAVRNELLTEARHSPGLLADLANLERYIAETYSARSFIELLQNADDAKAHRVHFAREGDWLLCANDGLPFNQDDFYSLCRSASSSKKRGQTIGYRGIGFKSVVGVADTVHLFSGTLRASFSRRLTHDCLGIDTPAPLIRIPHPLALAPDEPILKAVRKLEESGFTTIFVLGGLDIGKVEEEFAQFDADYLLFLRHVNEAVLSAGSTQRFMCERSSLGAECMEIKISAPDRQSDWRIHRFGQCNIAFSMLEGKLAPLTGAAALAHAFLPTMESTGLGVRINADFSTDPSRTRIVFDNATLQCIDDAATAIAQIMRDAISQNSIDSNLLSCLAPTVDLSTLAFQKRNLRTELITRLRGHLSDFKDKVILVPAWLNATDAHELESSFGLPVISLAGAHTSPLVSFLRYIGVQPLTVAAILKAVEKSPVSLNGCAEIIAFCIRNQASADIKLPDLATLPMWQGAGQSDPAKLPDLASARTPLAPEFLEMLARAGTSEADLQRVIKTAIDTAAVSILLPNVALPLANVTAPPPDTLPMGNVPKPIESAFDPLLSPAAANGQISLPHPAIINSQSLPAWRGAEQYVAQALESYGYSTEDRSRQNLGYDLYAAKTSGKFYVEVKMLDYAGQPFTLTSNEEAVARECGDAYVLALVLRGKDGTHLQFVRNPASCLRFVRQCRQWVWECSEYEFQSQVFQGND
jgi:hypothetical protein